MSSPSRFRVAVGAVSLTGVLFGVWWTHREPNSPWTAVVILAPLLMAATALAWHRGHRLLSGLALMAGMMLGLLAHAGHSPSAELSYGLEQVGIHLSLAAVFGSTLRRDAKPLITRLAAQLHNQLTPAMLAYTRQVTALWTAYFIAMALLSAALFVSLPFAQWAFAANVLSPLGVLLLFVGEHRVRYWLHPEFERTRMKDAARAFMLMQSSSPSSRTRPAAAAVSPPPSA